MDKFVRRISTVSIVLGEHVSSSVGATLDKGHKECAKPYSLWAQIKFLQVIDNIDISFMMDEIVCL